MAPKAVVDAIFPPLLVATRLVYYGYYITCSCSVTQGNAFVYCAGQHDKQRLNIHKWLCMSNLWGSCWPRFGHQARRLYRTAKNPE